MIPPVIGNLIVIAALVAVAALAGYFFLLPAPATGPKAVPGVLRH